MFTKKQTSMAIAAILGTAVTGVTIADSLTPGNYTMTIRTTPTLLGIGIPDVGCVGTVCSNSSFTFGGFPSATSSQVMADTGSNSTVTSATAPITVNGFGDAIDDNDGNAGVINFTVGADGETLTFTGGQVDTVQGTAASNFAQELNLGDWTGTIDAAGRIDIVPTNRAGHTSSPAITGSAWNVDDFNDATNTAFTPLTTGISGGANTGGGPSSTIQGQNLGVDHSAVLVGSSAVGSDWGTFFGGVYYEVWAVDIAAATVVPVPAAVWLFGSGLVGLVGVARRRKNAA